jgi:hypothetical protein
MNVYFSSFAHGANDAERSEFKRFRPSQWNNKNLTVSDSARSGDSREFLTQPDCLFVGHPNIDLHFRQVCRAELRSAIAIEVTLLPAVPLRLAHGAGCDAEFRNDAQHGFRTEWLDHNGELFHGSILPTRLLRSIRLPLNYKVSFWWKSKQRTTPNASHREDSVHVFCLAFE